MPNYNHVTMMGNLTKAPELRYAPSGTPIASTTIAVNRTYKQGDETKKEVLFLDVVSFGKVAELINKYLDKGSGALFAGRLQQRNWETDDGQKRSKIELVVEQVQFIGKPKGQNGDAEKADYDDQ